MSALSQVPRQELMVEHFDSPLRFHVKSRTKSDVTYLVDLGSEKYPDGECGCKFFITTVGPAQLRGEHKRCWHIHAARDALCDWIVDVLKKQDQNMED